MCSVRWGVGSGARMALFPVWSRKNGVSDNLNQAGAHILQRASLNGTLLFPCISNELNYCIGFHALHSAAVNGVSSGAPVCTRMIASFTEQKLFVPVLVLSGVAVAT
jgi:hypothetical protein